MYVFRLFEIVDDCWWSDGQLFSDSDETEISWTAFLAWSFQFSLLHSKWVTGRQAASRYYMTRSGVDETRWWTRRTALIRMRLAALACGTCQQQQPWGPTEYSKLYKFCCVMQFRVSSSAFFIITIALNFYNLIITNSVWRLASEPANMTEYIKRTTFYYTANLINNFH